jgi:hypothetical protein
MLFEMIAVFSFGGRFNTMAEPGFFVPALRSAFYTAGTCCTKKGGVDGEATARWRLLSNPMAGEVNVCLSPMGAAHTAVGGSCMGMGARLYHCRYAQPYFTKQGNGFLWLKQGKNPKKAG